MDIDYNPDGYDQDLAYYYYLEDFYPDGYDPELDDYPRGMDKRYIIDQVIIPALGEFKDDYDLEAIFEEAFEYSSKLNGFYYAVSEDEYWKIVEKHDQTIK